MIYAKIAGSILLLAGMTYLIYFLFMINFYEGNPFR